MKLKILIISTLISLLDNMSALGENPRMTLGCPIVDLPKTSTTGIDGAGTIQYAMLVNPNFAETIEDLSLVGFSYGLVSKINVSEVEVWATYALEEEPFASQKVKSFSKGWNEVELAAPVPVEQQPFYVGYTITTTGPSYPVGIVDTDYDHEIRIHDGNVWNVYESESPVMLAIGGIVSGVNLPQFDLSLIGAEIPEFLSTRNSNPIQIELRNVGGRTVSGFTITFTEGEKNLSQSYSIDGKIDPNFSTKVKIDYTPLSEESETNIPFEIAISELKDGADSNMDDNYYHTMVRVSPFSYKKRALVEEFTTEHCSNCPRAVKLLHDVLSEEYYWSNVIAVCHHAGFYTDFLTQPCDEEMLPLFGESSFAPAMAFDRALNNEGVVVSNVPLDANGLKSTFDLFINDHAVADINIEAVWNDNTNKIDITVTGGTLSSTPLSEADRVTVYLLEDNVAPRRQSGADADFLHHHVIRSYNSTWGDKITWTENGRFNYEVALDVPNGINIDNCEVVGVLGHINPDNVMDCQIANTNRCEKIDWNTFTGVESISAPDEVMLNRYYNLMGQPVSPDYKGIIIHEAITANGQRIVEKILK